MKHSDVVSPKTEGTQSYGSRQVRAIILSNSIPI